MPSGSDALPWLGDYPYGSGEGNQGIHMVGPAAARPAPALGTQTGADGAVAAASTAFTAASGRFAAANSGDTLQIIDTGASPPAVYSFTVTFVSATALTLSAPWAGVGTSALSWSLQGQGPSNAGLRYFATDTPAEYQSDGQQWLNLSSGGVYVQDILLAVDTTDIVFAPFPEDLHLLELTWLAWLTTADESLIYMFLNGDTPGSVTDDNFWNLTIANQVGSQGSRDTSGVGYDGGCGFAYVSDTKASWGTLRLPDYNADVSSGPALGAPWYSGHGGWAASGGGTPDTWNVSGYRQQTGQNPALSAIQLNALKLSDNSVVTFAAGSRFTLTGY